MVTEKSLSWGSTTQWTHLPYQRTATQAVVIIG